ncbi:MAG: hypothetical protein AAF434_14885 [Pseudomonadota bacterium]
MVEWINEWFFRAEIWVLLGIALLIIEVTLDGSMAIFLPLGLAAMLNAALLFLRGVWGEDLPLLTEWHHLLVSYLILAVLMTLFVRRYLAAQQKQTEPDVNDY